MYIYLYTYIYIILYIYIYEHHYRTCSVVERVLYLNINFQFSH